jgi:hypothetical protein
MALNRWRFLKSAAAAVFAGFAGPCLSGLRPMPAADAQIEINPSPGPLINPHLYPTTSCLFGKILCDPLRPLR